MGSPAPILGPPRVARRRVQGLEAAEQPSQLELQHLETFLAESTGTMASEMPKMHLWGCFWPASQTVPFSHSPSQGSYSQMGSSENIHLGFIWGWELQVQAQFVPG